jgi:uncharacterized protein (TIRG00374 family)
MKNRLRSKTPWHDLNRMIKEKNLAKFAVRIVITILLFYLIARSVHYEDVVDVIRRLDYLMLIPALVMQLVSSLVAAYRWYLIMRILQFGQTLYYYVASYFKGIFFNQALPTSIGGDAIRVLDAGKLGNGHKEAFYGVFIDRIVGLSGLVILNLAAILMSPDLLPTSMQWLIALMSLAGILGVIVLLFLRKLDWLTRYKITRMFHHISERMSRVYHSAASSAKQTGLSIIIHLLAMGCIYLIGRSVGLDLPFLTFLVLVPPALLLTILPVSLAGWGIRETALIGLFLLINADRAQVLTMSLIYGALVVVSSLPGLYFYLTGHTHKLQQLEKEYEAMTDEITEDPGR